MKRCFVYIYRQISVKNLILSKNRFDARSTSDDKINYIYVMTCSDVIKTSKTKHFKRGWAVKRKRAIFYL